MGASLQAGFEVRTSYHSNFNLAYGSDEPVAEKVRTLDASLSLYQAVSADFILLLRGVYSYNLYERYQYLTGSTATVLGGFVTRFNDASSLSFEAGKRERRYDNEELYLYEDDARFASLKVGQSISPLIQMNLRLGYEENEPEIITNKYFLRSAQLGIELRFDMNSTIGIGYSHSRREYLYTDNESIYDEPNAWLSQKLGSFIHIQLGVSKMRVVDQDENRAYNKTRYISIGINF